MVYRHSRTADTGPRPAQHGAAARCRRQDPPAAARRLKARRAGHCVYVAAMVANNHGHVLVVPNAHHGNLYDLPSRYGRAIHDLARQVAIAIRQTAAATEPRYASTTSLLETRTYGTTTCMSSRDTPKPEAASSVRTSLAREPAAGICRPEETARGVNGMPRIIHHRTSLASAARRLRTSGAAGLDHRRSGRRAVGSRSSRQDRCGRGAGRRPINRRRREHGYIFITLGYPVLAIALLSSRRAIAATGVSV